MADTLTSVEGVEDLGSIHFKITELKKTQGGYVVSIQDIPFEYAATKTQLLVVVQRLLAESLGVEIPKQKPIQEQSNHE